jgi:hypothetical protein
MSDRRHSRIAWRTSALACTLLAIALLPGARLVAGPRAADVHAEWRPFVSDAVRQQLEAQFRLEHPVKLADTYSWRYTLTDPSVANIQALVTHPAVADTHHIDRSRYTLEPTAPRMSHTVVGAADSLAALLLALAVVGAVTRTSPLLALQRGIPPVDAATAGVFRIVFGVAVLAFFATHARPTAVCRPIALGVRHGAVLDWLGGHSAFVELLTPWLLTTGVAFTVGMFTRLTMRCSSLACSYGRTSRRRQAEPIRIVRSSSPSWRCCLRDGATPAAWTAGCGGDAGHRRPRVRRAARSTYGYTMWVPGVIFGIAFAAAVWAKLSVNPDWTDWIANGTVKYHVVADSVNAPVEWGVRLAGYPGLAVVASLIAVMIEALVITASFIRNDWYRLAMGTAALALLSGFWLLMGVFWPAWWILLLGFLPWRRIAASRFRPLPSTAALDASSALTRLQLATILVVIAQQFVVSALAVERPPMFSWYPMYSGTYASDAEWNLKRPTIGRVVVSTDRGNMEVPLCAPPEEFTTAFEAALDGSREAQGRVWHTLRSSGADLSGARSATFEATLRVFDWDRIEYRTASAVRLGPLPSNGDTRR